MDACNRTSVASWLEMLDAEILVGFGRAEIRMDGGTIYDGEARWTKGASGRDDFLTFAHAARIGMEFPSSKVEVVINGPFRGTTWEWTGDDWTITAENGGFA